MKALLIASTALILAASAAEAKCTKKSLNGTWQLGVATSTGTGTMAGGNFSTSLGATPITLTITSFNSTKCRGSGSATFSGTPFSLTVASERIPGSPQSPNQLLVTLSGGTGILQLAMQRL